MTVPAALRVATPIIGAGSRAVTRIRTLFAREEEVA